MKCDDNCLECKLSACIYDKQIDKIDEDIEELKRKKYEAYRKKYERTREQRRKYYKKYYLEHREEILQKAKERNMRKKNVM